MSMHINEREYYQKCFSNNLENSSPQCEKGDEQRGTSFVIIQKQ